jgi:hypothetical protein
MFRQPDPAFASSSAESQPDRSMQVLEYAVAIVAAATAILLAFVH